MIGVGSYQHAAKGLSRPAAGSDESASEALKRRSMMCVASSYIPAPTGAEQRPERATFFTRADRTAAA